MDKGTLMTQGDPAHWSGNSLKPLKPFDLEAAKAGKPLVTRDGKPARYLGIIRGVAYTVVIAVRMRDDEEIVYNVSPQGDHNIDRISECDVFMAPEIREYWVNLFRDPADGHIVVQVDSYPSKQDAVNNRESPNGLGDIYKDFMDPVLVHKEEIN